MRQALLLLAVSGAALAQEQDALARKADEALAAARKGDAQALAALAQEKEPGGWLLAHELCARGEHDAALRLAKAAPGKDFEKLPLYVESRRNAGDDAAAREALRRCESLFRAQRMEEALAAAETVPLEGLTAVLAALQNRRGYLLAGLDRYPEALAALRAAGETAERIGDLRAAADALDTCALLAHKTQSPANAAGAEKRLAAVQRARGDEPGLTECLVRLQHAYQAMNDLDSLVQLLDELIPRLEKGEARADLAEMLARAATVHVRVGRYPRAQQLAERALAAAEAGGNDVVTGSVLLSVASVQAALRQPEKALASQRRAVELLERGPPQSLALALLTAGQSCSSLEKYDDAIALFERAQLLFEEAGSPYVAAVLCNLGNAYVAKKETERGFALLEAGIVVAEHAGVPQLLATCLGTAAAAYLSVEAYGKAMPVLERATLAAEKAGSRDYIVAAGWYTGACLLAMGKPKEALDHVDRCVAIIGEIYKGLGEEQGAGARSKDAFVFRLGAFAALDLLDPARAFRYLETGRAVSLLESLGGRRALSEYAVPEALRKAEAEARGALKLAEAFLAEAERARDLKGAQARRKELDAARAELNDVLQRIQREAKAAAPLLYPDAVSIEGIQGALEADQALVLYDLPRRVVANAPPFTKRTMAMVLMRKEVRMLALAPAETLIAACDALVANDPEVDPAPRVAELRRLFVLPLALPKEAKRLLVSASGALSPVPLCLLFEDRTVTSIPSATTYGLLRAERAPPGRKVLALGDPVYAGGLEPLPHTRAEAKEVGDVVLLGDDATKAGLLAALGREPRWRAVHLACHGLVDAQRPGLSSLELTGGGLAAYEAMRMPFTSDLVVLSACETGKGKAIAGEGLLGFSRAFMIAGAPRVVVSLWPVEDKATFALMKRFHELWKGGTPAAEALRQAQDHVRGRKEWAHPMYWAAWQLWGLPD